MRQLIIIVLLLITIPLIAEDTHPGKALYDMHCATCHNQNDNVEARSLDTLQRMQTGTIENALVAGKMKGQAASLSQSEIKSVVAYIGGQSQVATDWQENMQCDSKRASVDTTRTATVSSFGFGYKNHRLLTAESAGLTTEDFPKLELAWSLAFPNVTMMRSQPAIVGNTLFLTPVESQQLYAFDISAEPCLQWTYSSDTSLRTSLTYGSLSSGQAVLVFGDAVSRIHMVDAKTGRGLWVTSLKRFPESIVTGTPQFLNDRVYASVSQFEIMVGANPAHECCKARGAVASLDATNGKIVWFTPTLPDAKPIRDRGDGQMIWGPSGAPVWTSPAIDEKRGLLYIGTGEANSEPAHKHTDAILAMSLKTGEIVWSFQASANDIYLAGCWRGNRSPNCPPAYSINRDVDFGASVIIASLADGADVLLAGQKSSVVWALDPDAGGKVLWKWEKGVGSATGGIHWGMAYDGKRVFAPLSDPGRARPGYTPYPGLYALEVDSGKLLWSHAATPKCEGRSRELRRCQRQYGYSGAPIIVDGAVVQGSLDGFLRAFDAVTGKLLFEYDTIQNYMGVNGVQGQGGAIDSASLAAANGMLFVNSGYGMFGQPAGNVLLAFKPAK